MSVPGQEEPVPGLMAVRNSDTQRPCPGNISSWPEAADYDGSRKRPLCEHSAAPEPLGVYLALFGLRQKEC